MGTEFVIREALFDDAPAIGQVSYLTWLHAYRGIIPDAELDSLKLEIESCRVLWRLNHFQNGQAF